MLQPFAHPMPQTRYHLVSFLTLNGLSVRVRVRVLTLVTMLMHQACEKIYYKKLLLLHEYGKNMSEKDKGK